MILDAIEQEFFGGDRREAMGKLSALVQDAAAGPGRAELLAALVERIDHAHPGYGAYLALAGGALVESGEPARVLGAAIIRPLARALGHAARMPAYFEELATERAEDGAIGVSRETL